MSGNMVGNKIRSGCWNRTVKKVLATLLKLRIWIFGE